MPPNLARMIMEDFLQSSRSSLKALADKLHEFSVNKDKKVNLTCMENNSAIEVTLDGSHFFLRSSIEYSNPQLTVEEVQGIIAARLLEVCGNYFKNHKVDEVNSMDVDELCEMLIKPPHGKVVAFLLNTDDVEPDRYSMNPLKESIVNTGQSAFPSLSVKTEELRIDREFMRKYEGTLITQYETELIEQHLSKSKNSYMNMVDAFKYDHLAELSKVFGIDLCLPFMRMPLTILEKEDGKGLLHYIIRESHRDYESIESVYNCMGRSLKNKTTLLTIPHSKKGYGSKRAARGKIYFDGAKLKEAKVTYKTTPLYPNAIDPKDVSFAVVDDQFTVEGEKFVNYDYQETPSSPQFVLYSLASPEDAAIWHGIGAFGASQLVKSYTSTHMACATDAMIKGLGEYGIKAEIPLQFNLNPEHMWCHPRHRNIDASIGCVENLEDLAKMGMKLECLSTREFAR